MEQENKTESILQDKSSVPASTGDRTGASSLYEGTTGVVIDFHSAEFNRTDDLHDNSGNYRSFETLDGIITADERHQMGRRGHKEKVNSPTDETGPWKKSVKRRLKEPDDTETLDETTPLTVISRGQTLIIDTDKERALACGKVLTEKQLLCTLLITKGTSAGISFPSLNRLPLFEVDAVSITGAFGSFLGTAVVNGNRKPLTEWFGNNTAAFDLVLDIQSTPSFAGTDQPMGYYAPGPDSAALDDAMKELPEMRGGFKKPQFVSFQKTLCFHGRSRIHDCRLCLEICPFSAIESRDRKILINRYLCQGCGGCALVCPTDAVRMTLPTGVELLDRLRDTLQNHSLSKNYASSLVISDLANYEDETMAGTSDVWHKDKVHFEVEQITSVRLELLLAAFAYGAGDVLVACGQQNQPNIREAAEQQVQMARAILQGLAMGEDRIRFALLSIEDFHSEKAPPGLDGLDGQHGCFPITAAPEFAAGDKRTLVRLITQHLYDQSGIQGTQISMPVGSPFGAVAIDTAICTSCMACAAACPSGALSAERDAPRILFRESRCHQCGLCSQTCPEGAIRLNPRLLCDPEAVEAQTILCEAESFRCVECGVSFATQAMINRVKEKLTGHWMYTNERQLRRLQMCRDCSARDTLTSQEMTP